MSTIIIVHGTNGNPDENWFPWLEKELEKRGFTVAVPQFPTPNGQTIENWMKTLAPFREDFGSDTILVGHSLGVPFILHVLETLDKTIAAAFLIAGFTGPLGGKNDPLNASIAEGDFNWGVIRKNCRKFFTYYSDNDTRVPKEKTQGLAKRLYAEERLIPGAGHFNTAAGFSAFPELLEDILHVFEDRKL